MPDAATAPSRRRHPPAIDRPAPATASSRKMSRCRRAGATRVLRRDPAYSPASATGSSKAALQHGRLPIQPGGGEGPGADDAAGQDDDRNRGAERVQRGDAARQVDGVDRPARAEQRAEHAAEHAERQRPGRGQRLPGWRPGRPSGRARRPSARSSPARSAASARLHCAAASRPGRCPAASRETAAPAPPATPAASFGRRPAPCRPGRTARPAARRRTGQELRQDGHSDHGGAESRHAEHHIRGEDDGRGQGNEVGGHVAICLHESEREWRARQPPGRRAAVQLAVICFFWTRLASGPTPARSPP